MEQQSHLNQLISRRNQLQPVALNAWMDALGHNQTNAMSANTSEVAPIMYALILYYVKLSFVRLILFLKNL